MPDGYRSAESGTASTRGQNLRRACKRQRRRGSSRTNEPAEDLHRVAHRRPWGGRRLVYEAIRSWTGSPADAHAGAVGALRPGPGWRFRPTTKSRQGVMFSLRRGCCGRAPQAAGPGDRAREDIQGDYSTLVQARDPDGNLLTLATPPTRPFRRPDQAGRAKFASSKFGDTMLD